MTPHGPLSLILFLLAERETHLKENREYRDGIHQSFLVVNRIGERERERERERMWRMIDAYQFTPTPN
jgi:hypothetical protein